MEAEWEVWCDDVKPYWAIIEHRCGSNKYLTYSSVTLHELWKPKPCWSCNALVPDGVLFQARMLLEIKCGK